jgi:hypothetical protein
MVKQPTRSKNGVKNSYRMINFNEAMFILGRLLHENCRRLLSAHLSNSVDLQMLRRCGHRVSHTCGTGAVLPGEATGFSQPPGSSLEENAQRVKCCQGMCWAGDQFRSQMDGLPNSTAIP